MIFLERNRFEIPSVLNGNESRGGEELSRATLYYSSGPISKAFAFKIYRVQEVKDALEQVFGVKCAYCESIYAATAPVDVEHFRPKGGVEEESGHQGYWWLANSWNNLLSSCIDCNRRRRHRIAIPGMSLEDLSKERKRNSGKLNSFPIRGRRCSAPGDDLTQEDPLLIDPTFRDPSGHVDYLVDASSLALMVPVNHSGVADPYGEATIYTFGLNRQRLVEQRTKLLIRLNLDFQHIKNLLDIAIVAEGSSRDDLIKYAMEKIDNLKNQGNEGCEYSALAARFFRLAKEKLISRYSGLVNNI